MSYTFSSITPSMDLEMVAGPRAMPMGVHQGSYAFGQAPEKVPEAYNGQAKVLLVLLLFAAYMNLLLNLMRIPEGRVVR